MPFAHRTGGRRNRCEIDRARNPSDHRPGENSSPPPAEKILCRFSPEARAVSLAFHNASHVKSPPCFTWTRRVSSVGYWLRTIFARFRQTKIPAFTSSRRPTCVWTPIPRWKSLTHAKRWDPRVPDSVLKTNFEKSVYVEIVEMRRPTVVRAPITGLSSLVVSEICYQRYRTRNEDGVRASFGTSKTDRRRVILGRNVHVARDNRVRPRCRFETYDFTIRAPLSW